MRALPVFMTLNRLRPVRFYGSEPFSVPARFYGSEPFSVPARFYDYNPPPYLLVFMALHRLRATHVRTKALKMSCCSFGDDGGHPLTGRLRALLSALPLLPEGEG